MLTAEEIKDLLINRRHMRPKIMPSHSIARTLPYNEQKVTIKQAECIYAANFLKDVAGLP